MYEMIKIDTQRELTLHWNWYKKFNCYYFEGVSFTPSKVLVYSVSSNHKCQRLCLAFTAYNFKAEENNGTHAKSSTLKTLFNLSDYINIPKQKYKQP